MAERIKMARKEMSVSQAEFAVLIDVSTRAVQLWEAGHREPRPKQIRKLAEVTERPLDYFIEVAA